MTDPAHGLLTDTQPAPAFHARAAISARNAWRAAPRSVRLLLAFVAFSTALGLLSYSLSRAAPAWWERAAPTAEDGPDLAERLERAVVSELHKGRAPGETWTITIDETHANAWLAHRLPRWIAHRDRKLADNLPDVRVRFERGALRLGAAHDHRVLTVSVVTGERLGVSSVRLGRLPLPPALARAAATDALPAAIREDPDAASALRAFTRAEHPADTSFRLEDGRRVRVVAIDVADRVAHITCVTERANGDRAHSTP